MTNLEDNKRHSAENLGEVPVGANGAVLVRERMAQIGREATNRVREEMQQLGRKIAETKEQGVVGNTKNEDKGARDQRKTLKTERARSA